MRSSLLSLSVLSIIALGFGVVSPASAQRKAGDPVLACEGGPYMKTYSVPPDRLDLTATVLEYRFAGNRLVSTWKLGKDRIMVWAVPADQEEIEKLIRKLSAQRT